MKATNTLAHAQLTDAAAARSAWAATLGKPSRRRRHRPTSTALRLAILVATLAWLCLMLEILKGALQ
jgi:hypothetical protein